MIDTEQRKKTVKNHHLLEKGSKFAEFLDTKKYN